MNENNKEYIQLLNEHISKYYKSQKSFALLLDIPPTTLSAILNKNRTATSSFKKKVFEVIRFDTRFSNEYKKIFEDAYLKEFDIKLEIEELSTNISNQIISSNEYLATLESNPLLNIFSDLVEDINDLKFSVGGLDRFDVIHMMSNISNKLNKNLEEYMSCHLYSKLKPLDYVDVEYKPFKNGVCLFSDIEYIGIINMLSNNHIKLPHRNIWFVQNFDNINDEIELEVEMNLILCEIKTKFQTNPYHIPLTIHSKHSTIYKEQISPELLGFYKNDKFIPILEVAPIEIYEYNIIGLLSFDRY